MISFLNRGSGGGSSKANIFIQNTEPETKEGIWFKKTSSSYDKLITADTISSRINEALLTKTINNFYDANIPVIGNELYFFGRASGSTTSSKYNVITGEETSITNLSVYRCRPLFAVGTNIYLFEGMGAMDFKVYDTLTNAYSTKASLPEFYYGNGNAVLYNNEIYLFGFFTNSNLPKAYKYNIENNTWSALAEPPITADTSNMTVLVNIVGDNVYIFYGTSAYKYNIADNSYTSLTSVPVNTKYAISFTMNSIIYIVGGESKNNSFISYDVTTDTYTTLNDLTYTVERAGAAIIGNTVYIVGMVNTSIGQMMSLTFISVNFEANSVVLHNGSTYKTALLTQPDNVQGRVTTSFTNAYMTDSSGNLITTDEKYYGNGTSWVEIV